MRDIMNEKLGIAPKFAFALLGWALVMVLAGSSVWAADFTKVRGTVTDEKGKPLTKVKVYFQNAEIENKKMGPVKTKKEGNYVFPFLDFGIENKWYVIPEYPGYKVLRVSWRLVDSQKQVRGEGDQLLDAKQKFPLLKFAPVGSDGVNEVNLTLVKEADFEKVLRAELAGQSGGAPPDDSEAQAAESAAAPMAPGGEAPGFDTPPAEVSKNVGEALDLIKEGKEEEAVPILKKYLEKNPDNAPIQFTLGRVYVDTKQFDLAIPVLAKALAVDPSQAGAHFYLGLTFVEMGRQDEALKEFLAEIPISPDQDAAYSNAASIYEKQGKQDEALEYYKKASELNPQRADLHASLASVYEAKGDQAKAEEQYRLLAEVDPTNAAVTWFNIGAIAKNNDKTDEAVRAFRQAVELNPQYALAHRELGYALVKQGDFAGAGEHMNKYLELAPQAPDASEVREMVKMLSN